MAPSNPSFNTIISGGILNYVSHVMFNAVNYLSTSRPLTFTLYCRHDLQVGSSSIFMTIIRVIVNSVNFIFQGKSTSHGKHRISSHGLLRSNVA